MESTNKQSNSIAMVDKGHQKLAEIHAHIKGLLKSNGDKNDLTEIFFSLSYFYENYLINEEIFLKKLGYPNIESHSASHKSFIKEIEKLKDIISKDSATVLKDLDKFISSWLNKHEMSYNKELFDFLKSKGYIQN